jgi:hypothetical protein
MIKKIYTKPILHIELEGRGIFRVANVNEAKITASAYPDFINASVLNKLMSGNVCPPGQNAPCDIEFEQTAATANPPNERIASVRIKNGAEYCRITWDEAKTILGVE